MRWALTIAVIALAACSDDSSKLDSAVVHEASLPIEAGGPCSQTGTKWGCDPISGTGCKPGSCYLLKETGPACVCSGGGIATGASCEATIQCAVGNVCQGATLPGTCRKICNPSSAQPCPTGTCASVEGFPQFGLCI